ncbi:hypothetical protein F511_12337 [Dorcoceras hygrometricum]|uniref:Uncharacterized protein n=1 Tax=Dorcoceras hygrometricum TaxID=472368 RepID=A0A2Z7BNF9_9LAMI|nr:hypothetical protein F511_12337 [Dorcoceras hygrometricum]
MAANLLLLSARSSRLMADRCWPFTRTGCAIPEHQDAAVRRSWRAMIIAAAHVDARWLADHCALFCALMRDMHGGGGRRPATISVRLLRRLNFASRFCSGLSRAAREVFGPMFDIGPILVDFEFCRPATISVRLLRRLNFASRFCSGLSRAAREVFGPMFDIGPILVDFEF